MLHILTCRIHGNKTVPTPRLIVFRSHVPKIPDLLNFLYPEIC